jgi:hypothetical protein
LLKKKELTRIVTGAESPCDSTKEGRNGRRQAEGFLLEKRGDERSVGCDLLRGGETGDGPSLSILVR